jgi:hypothetical protein
MRKAKEISCKKERYLVHVYYVIITHQHDLPLVPPIQYLSRRDKQLDVPNAIAMEDPTGGGIVWYIPRSGVRLSFH